MGSKSHSSVERSLVVAILNSSGIFDMIISRLRVNANIVETSYVRFKFVVDVSQFLGFIN